MTLGMRHVGKGVTVRQYLYFYTSTSKASKLSILKQVN